MHLKLGKSSWKASRIIKKGLNNGKAINDLQKAALKSSKPHFNNAWLNAEGDLKLAQRLLNRNLLKPTQGQAQRKHLLNALTNAWEASGKDLEKGIREGLPFWNSLTLVKSGEASRVLSQISPTKLALGALAAGGAGLAYLKWGQDVQALNLGYPGQIPPSQWSPFYPAPGSTGYPGNNPGAYPGYPGLTPGGQTNNFPGADPSLSGGGAYNPDGTFRLNALNNGILS
ncbi:MAG: hypothetical protein AB7P76_07940 [Candidatus Melainabacteria bacterium]